MSTLKYNSATCCKLAGFDVNVQTDIHNSNIYIYIYIYICIYTCTLSLGKELDIMIVQAEQHNTEKACDLVVDINADISSNESLQHVTLVFMFSIEIHHQESLQTISSS